ncbi:MMPL family transporter [Nocardioides sp.]|uniref:MMPL family transporter n=1 Tax=Nocardioides sp. TaxID=35761 RepID=UPI0026223751|nr:MMPL family transporter [Nocardioides sp.]
MGRVDGGDLSVLVFGAGTNYALLLISCYRDELRTYAERRVAMSVAVRRTAEAVLASATTVVLGLLTLSLSVVSTTRGLGLACAIGVVIAAAFVLVVLPAVLVLFGRWVFWPRIPNVGDPALVDTDSFWHKVGERVARCLRGRDVGAAGSDGARRAASTPAWTRPPSSSSSRRPSLPPSAWASRFPQGSPTRPRC